MRWRAWCRAMISATDSRRSAVTSLRSPKTSTAPRLKSINIGPPVSGARRRVVRVAASRENASAARSSPVSEVDARPACLRWSAESRRRAASSRRGPQYARKVPNVWLSKSSRCGTVRGHVVATDRQLERRARIFEVVDVVPQQRRGRGQRLQRGVSASPPARANRATFDAREPQDRVDASRPAVARRRGRVPASRPARRWRRPVTARRRPRSASAAGNGNRSTYGVRSPV